MYLFPKFSSFYMFSITFSTILILFNHIIYENGIICILMLMYLLLHIGNKVINLNGVVFIIITCVSICEVKLFYDVLPKILIKFSNCLLFVMCHIFLIHYGAMIFLEFGLAGLRKEDLNYLVDITAVMFVSFPLIVSTIWSYVGSLYFDLTCIPFLFQLIIFVLYQSLLRSIEFLNKSSSMLISLVQLFSGVVTHVGVTFYSFFFLLKTSWNQIIIDHIAIWSLGILLTSLIPTTRVLQIYGIISDKHIKKATILSSVICYIILLPVLHAHGIHFHTANVIFMEMVTLGIGLILVVQYPRKLNIIIISVITVLGIVFACQMPWGIQLLPRTTLFLERIYLSIICMTVMVIIAIRCLVTLHQKLKDSIGFQIAFLLFTAVFHSAEWSLYFTHLAPIIFISTSGLFLLITELCLFSGGRISTIASSVIESQIFLKVIVLLIHYSVGNRISVPFISILATLVAGFILSYSMKAQLSESILLIISKWTLLFICLIIIRDSVVVLLAHSITGEEIIFEMTVLQCLVLSFLLDFISNFKFQKNLVFNKQSKVRALFVITTSSLLIDRTLPLGLILLGIYFIFGNLEDRWILIRVVRQSLIFSTGCILLVMTFSGPVLIDLGLMLMIVAAVHIIYQLCKQSSIRIFKRYFIRTWLFGIIMCALELFFGGHVNFQYTLIVGFSLSVAFLVTKPITCLETVDSNLVALDILNVLSKVRVMSILQCFFCGIIAYRFNFFSLQILILPMVFLLLERPKCSCEYQELGSKQINIISLIVSTLGLLLLLSTLQQSPLFLTSIFTSAQELSLHLDLSLTVQGWFELVLSCLLGICHVIMLVLSFISIFPHDCTKTSKITNLDYWLLCHTATVPISLGFIFCSTSISSVALAFISFAAGARNLLI